MLCNELCFLWLLVQHGAALPWARSHSRYVGAVSFLQLVQAVPAPACTSLETFQHVSHLVVQAVLMKTLMAMNIITGSSVQRWVVLELYLCAQESRAGDTWEPPQ